MNITNLIILLLAFMIIIYIYNDFIHPYLSKFLAPYFKKYIFQNTLVNTQENFTQYSSLSSPSNKNSYPNLIIYFSYFFGILIYFLIFKEIKIFVYNKNENNRFFKEIFFNR